MTEWRWLRLRGIISILISALFGAACAGGNAEKSNADQQEDLPNGAASDADSSTTSSGSSGGEGEDAESATSGADSDANDASAVSSDTASPGVDGGDADVDSEDADSDGTADGDANDAMASNTDAATADDEDPDSMGSGAEASNDSGVGSADTPYANVSAVVVSGGAGSYHFDVSVQSADIDCGQFADWWEVLSEDGDLLYRRILQHPHTDENCTSDADAPGNTFTRGGGPVDIAEDQIVYVRAHISTGGYTGVVFVGSAAEGFSAATDLDAGFAADAETTEPLPTSCYEPEC